MRINDTLLFQELLGSEMKQRVLLFLLANQAPLTERELARLLGKSHTAVNRVLNELKDLNAIECKAIGRAHVWTMNEKSLAYEVLGGISPYLRINILRYIKDALRNSIKGLDDKSIIGAYIFGSVSEGTAGPDSDIDVLIIIKKGKTTDNIIRKLGSTVGLSILEKTGNGVSFHIYGMTAVERNKPNWLKEAIEKGIKVY